MEKALKDYNNKKPVNKRLFYWGSKPLGLECFKFLIHVIRTDYPTVKIIGVCISEKDIKKDGPKKQDIRKIAKRNDIRIFTENDSILIKGDLGICIGYPHKIPKETISRFKSGIINLHFAPLPYYRGSKTLNHAILNDERKYGVSFHYIDESLDTGPIIDVEWYTLPDDRTAGEITAELEKVAFTFFKSYIHKMLKTILPAVSQEDIIKNKKIVPKFYKRDSLYLLYKVSLNWPFEKIYRTVRALSEDNKKTPYLEKNGKRIYLSTRKQKPVSGM